MKLKLAEIIALNFELNGLVRNDKVVMQGLMRQKMSLKVKLYLQRLDKLVQDEVELYNKAIKENKNEDELKELLEAEKEIEVKNLWSSDLTSESISSIETDEHYPIFFKLIDA